MNNSYLIMMDILAKQKFLKPGIRWLLASGVISGLTLVSLFVYPLLWQRTPSAVKVTTTPLKPASVELTINESGVVELARQQTLKAPNDSTVEQVLVTVGESVQAGQEVIILRNPERETRLANQLAFIEQSRIELARNWQRVQSAEQKLLTAQQQVQIQELAFAEKRLMLERYQEQVGEKKVALEDTQKELESLQKLADKGFIAGDQIQQQQKLVRDAEIAVRDAELTVKKETLIWEREKLQKASEIQATIASATAELQDAKLNVDTKELELQRQELEFKKIEQELQNTLITVPLDGKILNVKVNDGDGVARGGELLTLGDPTEEYVRLSLSTLNAAKVRLNQPARITVIGPNSLVHSGKVVAVAPQAIAPSQNQESTGQATVSAIVKLHQPTGTLIPGSQVNVEIILDQRENVLAVSLEAIQRSGKQNFVWVKDGQNLAQKREVTLGLQGLATVEITSGLKPGDQIILPQSDTLLKPGIPVIDSEPSPSSS